MKLRIIIIVSALLTLPLTNPAAIAQYHNEEALQQTAREIYDLVMCPLCAGQTIAQSNNETSRQMRDLVVKKLRQGESKEDILRYFESRYGERIMAKPSKKGFNLLLWMLPFGVVVLAGIVIYFLIRRWSARSPATSTAHFNENQFSEYRERFEKELKQFDEAP